MRYKSRGEKYHKKLVGKQDLQPIVELDNQRQLGSKVGEPSLGWSCSCAVVIRLVELNFSRQS